MHEIPDFLPTVQASNAVYRTNPQEVLEPKAGNLERQRGMPTTEDEQFMNLALEQARHGIGLTSPNPPVGAVLVKDGIVIGQGWHHRAGMPHAEVEALRDAQSKGNDPQGATAYVTLEPCSTHGRTGACTVALIKAGISRVVYGTGDPNPHHAGSADKILSEVGIGVTSQVLQEACQDLIRPFAKWITTGLPYVIAKAGQSLDGRLTRPAGESQWITSEAARAHAMQLRVKCDAILIGGETLRRDNPKLTLRGENIPKDKQQPWRVIVTQSGNLPADATVFTDEQREKTLVLQGTNDFHGILRELAQRQITSVLLECGGNLMGQAFAAKVVDEVCWYIAPRINGSGVISVETPHGITASSVALSNVSHEIIGDNVCVKGYPLWT